jgi:hypothetical protein
MRPSRGVVAALAAVAVAVTVAAVVAEDGEAPAPRGSSALERSPTSGPSLSLTGAAWADSDGIHVAGRLLPTQDLFADPAASMGLVRHGVVSRARNGVVTFRAPGVSPRRVGCCASAGPVGDPRGSLAAWIEAQNLVVYDTQARREVARTRIDAVGPSDNRVDQAAAGSHPQPILWVGPDRVRYEAAGRVWDLHLTDGSRPRPAPFSSNRLLDSAADLDAVVGRSVRDRLTKSFALTRVRFESDGEPLRTYGPVFKEGSLSSDGRYLATATGYDRGHRLVVVDVRTGEAVRLDLPDLELVPGFSPWAWAYGDTLMVIMVRPWRTPPQGVPRSTPWIVSCDVSEHSCRVHGRGDSTLALPN